MDEKRLQKRYAQSLFDLACEKDITKRIFDDITYIYNVCKTNTEFEAVLKNPVIKPLKKKDILLALFEKDCDELTIKFLSLIASKRREIYLRSICEEFFNIYNAYNNIKVAVLRVAQPMSVQTKQMIQSKLEADFNCNIELREQLNENLIGGFIITIDGKQYDASFLRKLNDLKRRIIT